jgi:hypothetical protein
VPRGWYVRSVAVCDLVVVGSYPPMPGPATAATIAAVRRGWDAGTSVQVVSYRTGAAPIAVPVTGTIAGWRLEQVRRHFGGPAQIALGLQRGVPFSDPRPSQQIVTAVGLAVALRRFERAALLVGEDPEVLPMCLQLLARAVDHVSVATPAMARQLVERYKLRPANVTVEEVEPYPKVPYGVDVDATGLYAPGSEAGLTLVTVPTTSMADRVRARAHLSGSSLARRLRGH